jgi:PKD domain
VRHGLLVALTLLGFAAPARAADVTVAPAGGEPVTLSIAELEPSWDVHERPYTVGGEQIVVTGISIDRLLDRAGVDPFGYGDVTVGEVVLTRDEMIDPAAFPEGRPVFWVDAEGSHFLKPGGERLSGPFTVALAARGSLRVTARASRRRVEAGERVTFTARVEGGGAGVRVRWTFDDGEKGTGLRVRHAFDRPGTYKVVVGATSDADPTGASAIVRVRVGEPAESPDREGGGTDEDEDAPESGPAPAAPAAPAAPSSGPAAGGDAPRERPRSRPAPKPRQRAKRRPPARGDEITGVLLDDFGEPATAVTAAARTGDPEPAVATELPEEALVALLALAIVAFGSWREARPA